MKIGLRIAIQSTLGEAMDDYLSFADTLDTSKYTDVTSASSWVKYGPSKYDTQYIREQIQAITFAACTTDEDKIACVDCSACTPTEALTVTGVDEAYIDNANKNMALKLKQARDNRIEAVREEVGNEVLRGVLTYADSNAFLDDTKDLFENFIIGANPAFIDWMNSTGDYTSTGFASKSYYSQARKDKYIDILVNGNY